MRDVVAITTIRQGDPSNNVERVRAEVFLDTAQALATLDIPCLAIFVDCEEEYLARLKTLDITPVRQSTSGMGNIRREALREGLRRFPTAPFYVWLEPEKPKLPVFVEDVIRLMQMTEANLGLFNRTSMDSYPDEQAHYYMFCRSVASALLGFDIDYAFGPMVLTRQAVQRFLDYSGEYGDKWESILIPRLRLLKEGDQIVQLSVDFRNDPRMTAVESGNPLMILKRIEQFNNVVPSLIAEWGRLKR